MAFFVPLDIPDSQPAVRIVKQLFAFERITVQMGQSARVSFDVSEEQLALTDGNGDRVVFGGRYRLVFTNGAEGSVMAQVTIGAGTKVLSPFPQIVQRKDRSL